MKKLLLYSVLGLFPLFGLCTKADPVFKNAKSGFSKHRRKPAVRPLLKLQANQYPLLRLKMVMDAFNFDDIAIGFNTAGSLNYNNQLDSRYMPGINAPEGLSCLSADSVPLSVAIIPYPKQQPITIRLNIEAANSGSFTMMRSQLDTIPAIYSFWLIDDYKKDSVDLRKTINYSFSVDKLISESYGANRFKVVIRQDAALTFKLVNFHAVKRSGAAQLNWNTTNEQGSTTFEVERSIDNGYHFFPLTVIRSDGEGAYSYTDKSPVNNADAYRLKITDMNGAVTYSALISLDFNQHTATASRLNIYPNPSAGIINLIIDESKSGSTNTSEPVADSFRAVAFSETRQPAVSSSYTVKILNMTGTLLNTAVIPGNTWQGHVGGLLPGTYIVHVINNANNTLVGSGTFVKL